MIYLAIASAIFVWVLFWFFFQRNRNQNEPKNAILLLKLVRHRSFGRAKVFGFSVFSNGKANYIGQRNIQLIGHYETHLDDSQMNEIKNRLENLFQSNIESHYLSNLRDLQKIELQYGEKSIIFHKRKAPESLKDILLFLEEMIEDLNWEKLDQSLDSNRLNSN